MKSEANLLCSSKITGTRRERPLRHYAGNCVWYKFAIKYDWYVIQKCTFLMVLFFCELSGHVPLNVNVHDATDGTSLKTQMSRLMNGMPLKK